MFRDQRGEILVDLGRLSLDRDGGRYQKDSGRNGAEPTRIGTFEGRNGLVILCDGLSSRRLNAHAY